MDKQPFGWKKRMALITIAVIVMVIAFMMLAGWVKDDGRATILGNAALWGTLLGALATAVSAFIALFVKSDNNINKAYDPRRDPANEAYGKAVVSTESPTS